MTQKAVMSRCVYVASSWRCPHQPRVVDVLRADGHEVYDFRHPEPGNNGFSWSQIDPDWQVWTPERFRAALNHPIAEAGFNLDMAALQWCQVCVLVMPAGCSANLELGYAVGAGKHTVVYLPKPCEPELMWRMCSAVVVSLDELRTEVAHA